MAIPKKKLPGPTTRGIQQTPLPKKNFSPLRLLCQYPKNSNRLVKKVAVLCLEFSGVWVNSGRSVDGLETVISGTGRRPSFGKRAQLAEWGILNELG